MCLVDAFSHLVVPLCVFHTRQICKTLASFWPDMQFGGLLFFFFFFCSFVLQPPIFYLKQREGRERRRHAVVESTPGRETSFFFRCLSY